MSAEEELKRKQEQFLPSFHLIMLFKSLMLFFLFLHFQELHQLFMLLLIMLLIIIYKMN